VIEGKATQESRYCIRQAFSILCLHGQRCDTEKLGPYSFVRNFICNTEVFFLVFVISVII